MALSQKVILIIIRSTRKRFDSMKDKKCKAKSIQGIQIPVHS